ncbi:MAG: M16 family metallopeptidase [Myxococcaceae bacterium]
MSCATRPNALALAALLCAGCASFQESWRGWAPADEEKLLWLAPEIKHARLPNGLSILVVEHPRFERVAVAAAFRLGSSADPPGLEGLTSVTVHALAEGSASHGGLAFHEALEALDGSLAVISGPDRSLVGWTVPAARVDEAVALLAEVVLTPSLSADAVQRVRDNHRASLVDEAASPYSRGEQRLLAAIYGPQHPYALPSAGSARSLTQVTAAGVRVTYGQYVGPNTTALVFAGPVGLAQAIELSRRHFGGWNGKANEAPRVPPAEPPWNRPPGFLAKLRDPPPDPYAAGGQGQPQALMLFGSESAAAGDADEVAQLFGRVALGRLLSFRLREVKGYTYSVSAGSWAGAETGLFMGATEVRPENVRDAERELRNVVKAVPLWLAQDDDAMAAARKSVLRSSVHRFSTLEACAVAGAELYWQRQPADRYERLFAAVQAAEAADVVAALGRAFDTDKMMVVVIRR